MRVGVYACCNFTNANPSRYEHDTRSSRGRHTLQLVDRCDDTQLKQFKRSLFGMVKVWNALPAVFVQAKEVSSMQSKLTLVSKRACSAGAEGWHNMYATTALPVKLLRRFCIDFDC